MTPSFPLFSSELHREGDYRIGVLNVHVPTDEASHHSVVARLQVVGPEGHQTVTLGIGDSIRVAGGRLTVQDIHVSADGATAVLVEMDSSCEPGTAGASA